MRPEVVESAHKPHPLWYSKVSGEVQIVPSQDTEAEREEHKPDKRQRIGSNTLWH